MAVDLSLEDVSSVDLARDFFCVPPFVEPAVPLVSLALLERFEEQLSDMKKYLHDQRVRAMLARVQQTMVDHCCGDESEECKPTRKRERESTAVDEQTVRPTADRCPHGSHHDKVIVPTQGAIHTYSLCCKAVETRIHGQVVTINVYAASSPSGQWTFDCNQCRCAVKFEVCMDGERFDGPNPKAALAKAGIKIKNNAAWNRCGKLRVGLLSTRQKRHQ